MLDAAEANVEELAAARDALAIAQRESGEQVESLTAQLRHLASDRDLLRKQLAEAGRQSDRLQTLLSQGLPESPRSSSGAASPSAGTSRKGLFKEKGEGEEEGEEEPTNTAEAIQQLRNVHNTLAEHSEELAATSRHMAEQVPPAHTAGPRRFPPGRRQFVRP